MVEPYKVGQWVRITNNPEWPKEHPVWVDDMNHCLGEEAKIAKLHVSEGSLEHHYTLEIGRHSKYTSTYIFAHRWLTPITVVKKPVAQAVATQLDLDLATCLHCGDKLEIFKVEENTKVSYKIKLCAKCVNKFYEQGVLDEMELKEREKEK